MIKVKLYFIFISIMIELLDDLYCSILNELTLNFNYLFILPTFFSIFLLFIHRLLCWRHVLNLFLHIFAYKIYYKIWQQEEGLTSDFESIYRSPWFYIFLILYFCKFYYYLLYFLIFLYKTKFLYPVYSNSILLKSLLYNMTSQDDFLNISFASLTSSLFITLA